MARIKTTKALIAALQDHVKDNAAELQLKLGRKTYSLERGDYIGAVVGDRYAYVRTGDEDLFVELYGDNAIAMSPSGDVLQRVADDLLPEPEPTVPPQVIAALQSLANMPRMPKGYKYGTDTRGNYVVVNESTQEPVPYHPGVGALTTGSAKRSGGFSSLTGARPKSEPKPKLVKGLKLTRNKDGLTYEVSAIDAKTGEVTFRPIDGGETIKQKALMPDGRTVPVFWRSWQTAH